MRKILFWVSGKGSFVLDVPISVLDEYERLPAGADKIAFFRDRLNDERFDGSAMVWEPGD